MELTESLNLENNNYFNNNFGQIINQTIENGMRALLPDFIENDIIEIKNTLVNEGLPQAVNETINKAIDFGKNAIGIVKNGFENIGQIGSAIEKGDLINGVSSIVDLALDIIQKNDLLSSNAINLIKDGKNVILNNVSKNINEELTTQEKNIEKLDNYNKKWRAAYENQDMNTMEKIIKKIHTLLENIAPIEKVINESKTIENLHYIIKNNDNNFNISKEDEELSKLLK